MSATQSPSQERHPIEGTILFPPVLGLERRPEGPRARLANTVRTADGDFTIVFQGDRAEVAEQLLRTGDRRVRALGVWDEQRTVFTVDRFDVLDADPSHRYRIDRQRTTGVVHDVDVSSLYPPDAHQGAETVADTGAQHRRQRDDERRDRAEAARSNAPPRGPGDETPHRSAPKEVATGGDGCSARRRGEILRVHARRLEPSGELLL